MRFLVLSLGLLVSSVAHAECVSVVSSWIAEVCYTSSKVVMVKTDAARYDFCGMSRSTFDAWASAASPGSYYNSHIKGRYSCY
jgi:hypothetical protein